MHYINILIFKEEVNVVINFIYWKKMALYK